AHLEAAPLPQVSLHRAAAHELDRLSLGTFDTIVINSVVQYFADEEYLVSVLRAAMDRLSPGGAIFVGDVRNLAMARAFYEAVELARSPGLAAEDLRARVDRRAAAESELLIDPAFFDALAGALPDLDHAVVRMKSGSSDHELVRYRYDAILRKRAAG